MMDMTTSGFQNQTSSRTLQQNLAAGDVKQSPPEGHGFRSQCSMKSTFSNTLHSAATDLAVLCFFMLGVSALG